MKKDLHTTGMENEFLRRKLASLPQAPGIYIYKNAKGEILYVGKAKNLRSRVQSYFRKSANLEPAKEKMVRLIADLESISTDTELEALVLEATLIRKHQPPYNVLLRDDKYYLFIKITKENPPRIFPVRKILKDGAAYFGPYSSAHSVRSTLKLLRRIFPFREEKDRPRDIIFPHTLFPQNTSGDSTEQVARFLRGNRHEIIKTLEKGIQEASEEMRYEQAALYRDQLQAIERLEGSQKVYLPGNESFDTVSISQAKTQSAGNVLQIREGKLIGKQTFLLRHRSHTTPEDIVRQFIMQYYSVAQDIPKTIYIPFALPDTEVLASWIGGGSHFEVPMRGAKKQLLSMGELNAKNLLREEEVETSTKAASHAALAALLKSIGLSHLTEQTKTIDKHIRVETYDISNIQGTLATASMVVFIDGVPAKDQYRKFKIRFNADLDPTKHKSNDFAMLHETLTRRLSRGKEGLWPLPDLLIIDGGKGQLSSARKALLESGLDIPMISIAKREEELFLPERKDPVLLPYDSPVLYLIQRMRDEAHRFTITYHRSLRSKEQTKSALDEIDGIGPKTKKLLLQTFGSVTGVKEASDEELTHLIGEQKMKRLREQL